MKILSITADNFGSYTHCDLTPVDQGLCIIQGPTGAGKSTIPDMIAWGLFGQTSKDGNAEDVRSWDNTQATVVHLAIETSQDSVMFITRIRGNPKETDLYFYEEKTAQHGSADPTRGKDLKDTQTIINAKLGITSELYFTGAFYCEFSPSSNFFLAKAKERREVFEKIASLTLPEKLATECTEELKRIRADIITHEKSLSMLNGYLKAINEQYSSLEQDTKQWESWRSKKLVEFTSRIQESEKAYIDKIAKKQERLTKAKERLEALQEQLTSKPFSKICETCGQTKNDKENSSLMLQVAQAQTQVLGIQQEEETISPSLYKKDLDELRTTRNPYTTRLQEVKTQVDISIGKANDTQERIKLAVKKESQLKTLSEVSKEWRKELLQTAINNIQNDTNRLLRDFFDAEFMVVFSANDADNLLVEIYKNNISCNFKQLSKGQRQILKLCFAVAIMQASANHAGVHFDNLWFDEALDGLDTNMKLKGYRLFQWMQKTHESIFVIDHSPEFQQMFDRRYEVTVENGSSKVTMYD